MSHEFEQCFWCGTDAKREEKSNTDKTFVNKQSRKRNKKEKVEHFDHVQINENFEEKKRKN